MQLPKFRVLLQEGDDQVEHEVTILHGDQLRAELEAPRHGLTDMGAAPMHFTTLWCWAALARTHVITDDFRAFKPKMLALEAVDDDTEVDPTQTGAATG